MAILRGLSPGRAKRRSPSRVLQVACVILCLLALWLVPQTLKSQDPKKVPEGPQTEHHVTRSRGIGGRWYIPPSWMHQINARQFQAPLSFDSSILDAAERALDLSLNNRAFMNNSNIPLIAHQTWRSMDARSWSPTIKESVEQWLDASIGEDAPHKPQMAWFLWDDDGIDALIQKYEPQIYEDFRHLPYPVERADVFRVVVLKWFGGIYADVDCNLLKHPFDWILDSDLAPWSEPKTSREHTLHTSYSTPYAIPETAPATWKSIFNSLGSSYIDELSTPAVNAIFGIEADNLPAPDTTYWQMGYTYPVQLTNWALAMAPQHPVANQFLDSFSDMVETNRANLSSVDPLDLTGPPALTTAVQAVATRDEPLFDWDSLSGRNGDKPGGRGKIVAGDALILPITGFSPGRGWFRNMGSQSINNVNARLQHMAAGSWRKKSLKVHLGKFCRATLGMCRDWKKIPEPQS